MGSICWGVGSPRGWLDKPMPYQVHAGDGVSLCNQNGFRYPSTVLLPLFTAVERTAEADGKPFDLSISSPIGMDSENFSGG